ncbi:MAG: hypothetical protein WBS15_03470 [Mycobacterium sp.]|uniref:hypothetical protein n=1 Tax=Mycobacterium sp. TaxID=1785 RepID=UPI003C5C2DE7
MLSITRATTTTTGYADVAPPPDATMVTKWGYIFDPDVLHRFFYGTQRGERVSVEINGFQNRDGSVRGRWIHVDGRVLDRQELDGAAARELARALIAAADELDGLEAQR